MQRRLVIGLCMAAGLLILPGAASAQSQAYTNSGSNVRAGPAADYPIVAQLPAQRRAAAAPAGHEQTAPALPSPVVPASTDAGTPHRSRPHAMHGRFSRWT
ncbi:hypothetical protein OKW37_003426 [Paraburkholderia sp. MM5482-R2]